MAAQYYQITCLLMACHQPELPRVGLQRLEAARQTEEQVRRAIRKVCGVALSNPQTAPALLVACQSISLCGDYFVDTREQKAVMDLLERTEAETGWPTSQLLKSLCSTWRRPMREVC